MKSINSRLVTLAVALVVVSSIFYFINSNETSGSTVVAQDTELTAQEYSQQDIIDDLMLSLKEQGVPIKSIQIMSDDSWNPPIVVAYVLQSSTEGGKASPNDPLYSMLVERTINLAQRRGLKIGAIGETWIDSEGEILTSLISVVRDTTNLNPQLSPPVFDNKSMATLISQDLPLEGMNLDSIEVFLDTDNFRWVRVEISVPDILIANRELPNFISSLTSTILNLNSKGAGEIAVFQIELNTTKGEPLLTYVDDLQLGTRIWWQADGLTEEWFPHPPPVIER